MGSLSETQKLKTGKLESPRPPTAVLIIEPEPKQTANHTACQTVINCGWRVVGVTGVRRHREVRTSVNQSDAGEEKTSC